MATAILAADTRALPDGGEGYEGSVATGFRAAENRILWTGDAGMAASLDDMIGYEHWIDGCRDAPGGLYTRLSAPVAFADGTAATYGFGLGRGEELGRAVTSHGGALRGWRSHRLYAPAERVSVVVMFNHLSDARSAAVDLFAAVLGEAQPMPTHGGAAPDWLGAYVEPQTGLSARIDLDHDARVRVRYGHWPDTLDLQADGSASSPGGVRLRPEGDALWMERPGENQSSLLRRAADGDGSRDVTGVYRCEALGAELIVADAGGALFGSFSGFLGQGRMERLEPIAADLWALPCWRALDHTPPGDWTLAFHRPGGGSPSRVEVGCWLARGLIYDRCG
jgi:D-aminopeptidase